MEPEFCQRFFFDADAGIVIHFFERYGKEKCYYHVLAKHPLGYVTFEPSTDGWPVPIPIPEDYEFEDPRFLRVVWQPYIASLKSLYVLRLLARLSASPTNNNWDDPEAHCDIARVRLTQERAGECKGELCAYGAAHWHYYHGAEQSEYDQLAWATAKHEVGIYWRDLVLAWHEYRQGATGNAVSAIIPKEAHDYTSGAPRIERREDRETPLRTVSGFINARPQQVTDRLEEMMSLDKLRQWAGEVGRTYIAEKDGAHWAWRTEADGRYGVQVQATPADSKFAAIRDVFRVELKPCSDGRVQVLVTCYDERWCPYFDLLTVKMQEHWPELGWMASKETAEGHDPWECIPAAREREMVRLWHKGMTNSEIADELKRLRYRPIQPVTVTKTLSTLRGNFGHEVVPTDEERRRKPKQG